MHDFGMGRRRVPDGVSKPCGHIPLAGLQLCNPALLLWVEVDEGTAHVIPLFPLPLYHFLALGERAANAGGHVLQWGIKRGGKQGGLRAG